MDIVCLDMEGVLVPEIWIAFAEKSGIPELKRTTRDEPDYDKLMRWRLGILRERGLGLKEIQDVIDQIDPLPGAKDFLDKTDIDEKLAGAAKDLKEKAKAALEKTDVDDRIMDAAKGLKEKAQEAYEKARPGVEDAFNKASAGAKELFDKSIEGIKGPEKPKDAMEVIQDEVDEQVEIIRGAAEGTDPIHDFFNKKEGE